MLEAENSKFEWKTKNMQSYNNNNDQLQQASQLVLRRWKAVGFHIY